MIISLEYKNQVLELLRQMRPGEIRQMNPARESYGRFCEAVKIIIDWGQDRDNGFVMEFSDDYTKIKKLQL